MYTLFLLPIIGAILGWLIIFAILKIFKNKIISNWKELALQSLQNKEIGDYIDQIDMESQIEPLMDAHLQTLIATFKRQIPMASMFLTNSLTTKMKEQASDELIKIIPELKIKFMDSFKIEKIKELDFFDNIIRSLFVKLSYKLPILGAVVGSIVSLISSVILIMIFQLSC